MASDSNSKSEFDCNSLNKLKARHPQDSRILRPIRHQDPSSCKANRMLSRCQMQEKKEEMEFRPPEKKGQQARFLKVKQDPNHSSKMKERHNAEMRKKRADPKFRDVEREKATNWMRQRRQDPKYRSQERERERARKKAQRSDPQFRKKERARERARLNLKKKDSTFIEKEEATTRGQIGSESLENINVLLYPGDEPFEETTSNYFYDDIADDSFNYFDEAANSYHFGETSSDYNFEEFSLSGDIFEYIDSVPDDSTERTSFVDF